MTHRTQAILLLTLHLGGRPAPGQRPLTPSEWGRFARWLHERQLQPERLLYGEPAEILADLDDGSITPERVAHLLGRGMALGLATERWSRAGIWILNRADPHYPALWRRRLGPSAPALLFGAGAPALLGSGGVAVVGSRNATEPDLELAAALGRLAAAEGEPLISGGARGVDQAAMQGALEAGGAAVGVLADSLLRASSSRAYRSHLANGRLALVTAFNPEARFEVGNAMARNRYVYCLARAAVVVASDLGAGGTWAGATDNLKHRWVPLWVARSSTATGNEALVQRGARWLPEDARVPRLETSPPPPPLAAESAPEEPPEPQPGRARGQHDAGAGIDGGRDVACLSPDANHAPASAARQTSLFPASHESPAVPATEALLHALPDYPKAAARRTLIKRSGIDEAAWEPAIEALLASGAVERIERRDRVQYRRVRRTG